MGGALRHIASEEPKDHWSMLNVKGKTTLDLGCGRLWEGFPSTVGYFIEQGAKKVIGVEMSPSEEVWYGEHFPQATIFTDKVDSPEKLKKYLAGAEVVKMDIEGDEALLLQLEASDLKSVQEMAIEYHDADKKFIIMSNYTRLGFKNIQFYALHSFDPTEQGVLYLTK